MTNTRCVFVAFCFTLLLGHSVRADETLIKEVEDLRNSLPLNDASIPTLTLRLADLMFDETVVLARNPDPTLEQEKALRFYQNRSLQLYQEMLDKKDVSLAPAMRMKIKFQKARLYSNMGNKSQAQVLWRELVNQDQLPELKRESALRLAECAEEGKTSSALALADQYYLIALKLCDGADLCSYIRYRRAWLLHGQGKHHDAIAEMQLALYDSRGQVREESLRDLMAFLATDGSDGQDALKLIDELSRKLQRPNLLQDLSSAYFSAGNKRGGVAILSVANTRKPQLTNDIRLLEEYYGLRRWDDFRATLAMTQKHALTVDSIEPKLSESREAEKILRRLTVQLDAERISQKDLAADFKVAALLYVQLFPKSSECPKVMDGWLAAENDNETKLKQLGMWVQSAELSKKDLISLHQKRAAIAQILKAYPVVVEGMRALRALVEESNLKREYRYHEARALYELKSYEDALPIFQELATASAQPDQWAIQSQNLALDILGQRKDFAGLTKQANLWLASPVVQSDKSVAKELADMRAVSEQAEFESAVAAGATPQALATFEKFCLERKALPKSCENGKVIAVQLKNQKSLLAILKAQDLKSDLAAEYEASGFFAESAEILEQDLRGRQVTPEAFLKVALLFELGGRISDRDRILNQLVQLPLLKKPFEKSETLIFETLKDSGLLKPSHLTLAWSPFLRARVANELALVGQGSPETTKILLATSTNAGKAWSHAVMTQLQNLDQAQNQIHFYGKGGKKNFEKRLGRIQQLAVEAEKYFPGAESETRVWIAALLARSYGGLAKEILDSPIPEGIPEDALIEVKKQVSEMAQPFETKKLAYEKNMQEQLELIKDLSTRSALEAKLSSQSLLQLDPMVVAEKGTGAVTDQTTLSHALHTLHDNPTHVGALTQLKAIYSNSGQSRVASYFQGRILQLERGGKQ